MKLVRVAIVAMTIVASTITSAFAVKLDEMSLDRWAKLREAERYQLNIAEKYYRESNWKVAADEYEKFLSLYEKSEGAPYAQLKWSICQANLRKLNTAIKDGYQSVIDYWPDSPEAVGASYLIGKSYKEMGEVAAAKKAYGAVLTKHPKELVAVLARLDMADMARVEGDKDRQMSLLKDLSFNTPRDGDAARHCVEASRQLATMQFEAGSFAEGYKALESTYKEPELSFWVWYFIRSPLQTLTGAPETKDRGNKMADAAVAYEKGLVPASLTDDAAKARGKQVIGFAAEILAYAAGRGDEVGKIYDHALQTFGNEDEILMKQAQWLKSVGRRDDARRSFGKMKDQIEGQWQIAYSYREENKWDQAIQLIQELLTKDAAHANRWQWQLGDFYQHAGKYTEAIATYRQCDNFPDNIERMAGCHRALKQFREALVLYQQVAGSAEQRAPEAVLQIAYTYEQAGQKETAIQSFQQVCKKFPKSDQASRAHAHLQNQYKITATLGGTKGE